MRGLHLPAVAKAHFWLITLLGILAVILPCAAQGETMPLDALAPISADNMDRVSELASLGPAYGGLALWSDDGQTLFFSTTVGTYAYPVSDPTDFSVLDQSAVDFPPMPRFEDIDSTQPIAVSPNGKYALFLSPLMSNERNALLTVQVVESGANLPA